MREISLLIKAEESKDRLLWNHTSALMSLYANSKARKGKSFSSEDFNPYLHHDKEDRKPKTRDDVMALAEQMKSLNG